MQEEVFRREEKEIKEITRAIAPTYLYLKKLRRVKRFLIFLEELQIPQGVFNDTWSAVDQAQEKALGDLKDAVKEYVYGGDRRFTWLEGSVEHEFEKMVLYATGAMVRRDEQGITIK